MVEQRERERDLAERIAQFADPSSSQAVATAAAFLLTVYAGLALAYRDAIPLFEAPDEPAHLQYAAFVYQSGHLPRLNPPDVPGVGMQPPLVYLVAAPLLNNRGIDVAEVARELDLATRPFYTAARAEGGGAAIASRPHGFRLFASDGSLEPLRVLRSMSLAFGLLTVILTFAAVWRLSRDARFALLAGSLVAFDPQFLFSSGYFSNDPAAAALGAAALWVVARALEDPGGGPARRHYFAVALAIAIGAMTKTSTLPGLVVAFATLYAIDARERRTARLDAAIAAGLVLLVAGPFALWTAEQRGDFLGLAAMFEPAVEMPNAASLGGPLAFLAGTYWDWTFESFWARFGWFNVTVARAAYLAFFALAWTGALGWLAGRMRLPAEELHTRALRNYLLGAFGATLAVHLVRNLAAVDPQGRLLFASISQVAFLIALGIARLFGSERRMFPAIAVVVLGMLVLDVYCLRGVLLPAYR